MADLVAKQQKTKYYQQFKDKKYRRLVKDDNQLEGEKEKQVGGTCVCSSKNYCFQNLTL